MHETQPPLSDYAMIGDSQTVALISKNGSIDWLCLPDFSSPSYFARLIDVNGGKFQITIKNIKNISRRYIPKTAVLETIMTSDEGSIKLTDCMVLTTNGSEQTELEPLREILRKTEVISGEPEIIVKIEPKPNYARGKIKIKKRGKLGWALKYKNDLINFISDFPLFQNGEVLNAEFTAKAGNVFWCSLTYENVNPAILPPIGASAQNRLNMTEIWWRNWVEPCTYSGPFEDELVRSLITLRLLTFSTSGALVAAATTSLPEKPKGWMNWDYRFCWPRDAALALKAFMGSGLNGEANMFLGWLMIAANATRPNINIVYDIYGNSNLKERILNMSGYRGAKPVRIGNKAAKQIQHDVYGEVMLAIADWIDCRGELSAAEKFLVQGFGKAVLKSWRQPDFGIWEIRDKPRHYTYSKVMAWFVFDSLIRLHEKNHIKIPLEKYKAERDELRRLIESEGFDKARNCFTVAFGEKTLDASLLLLPVTGFVKYDDPRMLATWQAIWDDLGENGLLYRYPANYGGSEEGEGSLLICNFWAVNYLISLGKPQEAEKLMEKLISFANDVGLMNEAVDVKTLQPLGNMPQAFSHAGLVNAIIKLYPKPDKKKEAA